MNSPQGVKGVRKKQTARKPSKSPSPLRAVFGLNLRLARIGKDMSINDAASKADVDWSYFAQIERGERSVGLDVMDALAQAVEVPVHQLLDPGFDSGPSRDER